MDFCCRHRQYAGKVKAFVKKQYKKHNPDLFKIGLTIRKTRHGKACVVKHFPKAVKEIVLNYDTHYFAFKTMYVRKMATMFIDGTKNGNYLKMWTNLDRTKWAKQGHFKLTPVHNNFYWHITSRSSPSTTFTVGASKNYEKVRLINNPFKKSGYKKAEYKFWPVYNGHAVMMNPRSKPIASIYVSSHSSSNG